jgi:YnfA/UPF0060 family uncharacterized protein
MRPPAATWCSPVRAECSVDAASRSLAFGKGADPDNHSCMTLVAYAGAAVAEIASCFTFWAWLRLGKSPLWLVPGILSLALFAYLLTRRERGRRAGLCGLRRRLHRRLAALAVGRRGCPA